MPRASLGGRVALGIVDLVLDLDEDGRVAVASAFDADDRVGVEEAVARNGQRYRPGLADGFAMPPFDYASHAVVEELGEGPLPCVEIAWKGRVDIESRSTDTREYWARRESSSRMRRARISVGAPARPRADVPQIPALPEPALGVDALRSSSTAAGALNTAVLMPFFRCPAAPIP